MNNSTKTLIPTQEDFYKDRKWHHLDADGKILGRLASRCAVLLKGKHKRTFAPSRDCGDFVVVTNAAKVKITGDKAVQKTYFSHSGYASGAKIVPYKDKFQKDSRETFYLAVKRMLAPNTLRDKQMKRLKIYPGDKHPHASQSFEASK